MKLVISESHYVNDTFVVSTSLSSDGRLIFVLQDGKVGMISRESESVLFDASVFVSNAAISPDGEWVAIVPGSEVIQVNIKDNLKRTFVFSKTVARVFFSPTGQILAIGLTSGQVYLRDTRSGKSCGFLEHGVDAKAVAAIAIDRNDRLVATALATPDIYLWDLFDASFSCVPHLYVSELHEGGQRITHLVFAENAFSLLCMFPDRISLVEIDRKTRQDIEKGGNYTSLAFSAPYLLAVGTAEGYIRLWTLEGTLLCEKWAHTNPVLHLAFSRDGNYLVSSDARHIKIWNVIGE